MLNEQVIRNTLGTIALSNQVEITSDYTRFMVVALNQYGFSELDLKISARKILEKETLYNKMPNLAMFLKYKPKTQYGIENYKALPRPKISKEDREFMVNGFGELVEKLKKRALKYEKEKK